MTIEEIQGKLADNPHFLKLAQNDPKKAKLWVEQEYENNGFGPDGMPLEKGTRAQKLINRASEMTGAPEPIVHGLAASILPTAGAAVGGTLGSVMGPAGATAGAMFGSGAGEAANQALGVTEPSATAIGVSAAAPGVARGVGSAYTAIKPTIQRWLPGSGTELQKMGHEAAQALGSAYKVTQQAVDDAYDAVKTHFNPRIELEEFGKRVVKVMDDRAKALALKKEDIYKDPLMKELSQTLQSVEEFGSVRLDMVQALMKDYTSRIGDAMQKANSGVLAYIKSGLKADLETGKIAGPKNDAAIRALQSANATNARRQGSKALDDLIENARSFRNEDRALDFKQGGMYKKIIEAIEHKNMPAKELAHIDDDIAKGYSLSELKDIKATMDAVKYIPPLPGLHGEALASGLRYGVPAIAGGYAGYKMGGKEGAAVGAAGGMGVSLAVSRLLQSEGGRRWLRNQKQLDPQKLMNFAAGMTGAEHGVVAE